MLQEYLTLREQYLTQADTQTLVHQNYVRNLFLYETFQLAGHNLPEEEFENIISIGNPQHTETTRQAYDLWKAWQYCEKKAVQQQVLDLHFTQNVSARILKHSGGEITTSVGRYDSSLGDFRLGEDYNEIYPLADFRKIPILLDNLCRATNAQLVQAGVCEHIKIIANFMYDFMHIKPFGSGNLETSLLLINYLELRYSHPLLILFAEDRAELLNALKHGKISETPETLEKFILEEQIKFFNREI